MHWYRHGNWYAVVEVLGPGVPSRVGYGRTVPEAAHALARTPVCGGGTDPAASALEWARGAGWFGEGVYDLEGFDRVRSGEYL